MSYLPSVKVGLLNVTWNNGSREKPLNPIPVDIIAQFEEKPDLDINWINAQMGLVVLSGDYNYLIFDNTKFYTLEKTRILDINQSIFVYTLTKDVWQTFLHTPGVWVEGHLIKTSNENVLFRYLQFTKLATLNINSEQIFLTNKPGERGTKRQYLANYLNVSRFERSEKGEIVKFGFKKRFVKTEFEAFKQKAINANYSGITKKPNQIISYCPLRKTPNWQNYIAEIVEDFLTSSSFEDPIKLGVTQNLGSVYSKLNTKLGEATAKHNRYIIQKNQNLTNATLEEQWVVKNIDLNEIDQIIPLDRNTLNEIYAPNKPLLTFPEAPEFPGINRDNKTWILKNKMFSPVHDAAKFNYLTVHKKAFTENYSIDSDKLTKEDIKSLTGTFTEHKYNFSETLTPAIYYPNWAETITDTNLRKAITDGNYSTELGFLMYKFANATGNFFDFYNNNNKFVYKSGQIQLTTGIKKPSRKLKCDIVKNERGEKVNTSINIDFSDVFRKEINKSFWLTLWSVYLWQGDFDRVFENLYPDSLKSNFKYTVPECYTNEKGELLNSEEKEDKKPTFGIKDVNTSNLTEFKTVLNELTHRRKDVEIVSNIYPPYLETGDILWNEIQSGFFDENDELKFENNTLVLFGDTNYNYTITNQKLNIKSLTDNHADYGYKLGLISFYKPERPQTTENNLITTIKEPPRIGILKTLLTDRSTTDTHNYDPYKRAVKRFLIQDGPNHPYWVGLDYYGSTWYGRSWSWLSTGWTLAATAGNVDPRYKPAIWLYDNYFSEIKYNYFDWNSDFPQYNNQLDWITGARTIKHNNAFYAKISFEHTNKNIYIYPQTGYKGEADQITNYINWYLKKDNYRKDIALLNRKSWSTAQQAGIAATGTDANKLIKHVYEYSNGETIRDNKYFHIDKEYLKQNTQNRNPALFEFKAGSKTKFYVGIVWNTQTDKPDIEIIINDYSLLIFEPAKIVTLQEDMNLKNTNLPQLMNQRNFLYAHGEYIELQTKILNPWGTPLFRLKIENLEINDPTTNHYKIYFDSEIEHIKKYISVAKLELTTKVKTLEDKEWLNFKLEQDYRRKTEQFERDLNKETERLTNQNFKNTRDDLSLEKGNFYLQNMLNAAGQVTGGFTAFAGGAKFLGASSFATGAAGAYLQYQRQSQQLEIKTRNLQQQDIENAFKIAHAKNTMDERHKNAELREQETLFKMVNVDINKIPNSADVLYKIEEKEGVLNHVCIYNRIPTGALLAYLTQYHQIYGYSIDVNQFKLTVQEIIESSNNSIYQFSRIDKLGLTDLWEYEQIKACFLNGIFLNVHEYKLNHLSYLELRKKHLEKVAIAKAKVLEAEKAQRQKELEEIAAIEKGKELAKTDYKDKVKEFDKCEEDLTAKTKELTQLKQEIERLKSQIQIYKTEEGETVKTEKAKTEQIRADFEKLEKVKNKLESGASLLAEEIGGLKRQLKQEQEEFDTEIQRLIKENVDDINDVIKEWQAKVRELEARTCPVCPDAVHIVPDCPPQDNTELLAQIKQLESDITSYQITKGLNQHTINTCNEQLTAVRRQLAIEQEACKDHEKKIAAASTNYRNEQTKRIAAEKERDTAKKALDLSQQELSAREKELETCKQEKEGLKGQEGKEAATILELQNTLQELAKKKAKLDGLRYEYALCWEDIESIYERRNENKGYYNYINVYNKTWYNHTYYILFDKGAPYLATRSGNKRQGVNWWRKIPGEYEGCFNIPDKKNYVKERGWDRLSTCPWTRALLPKNYRVEEHDYSSSYKGFRILGPNNYEVGLYLHYKVDECDNLYNYDTPEHRDSFEDCRITFKNTGIAAKNISMLIWNLKQEIANYIRNKKHLFKNENDAINMAYEWEQLNW